MKVGVRASTDVEAPTMSRSPSDARLPGPAPRFVLPAAVAIALAVLLGPVHRALADCDDSLLDDSVIKINTVADANNARTNLITRIWGNGSLPNGLPNIPAQMSITPNNIADPNVRTELTNLLNQLWPNYGRVDLLQHQMRDSNGNVVHTALGWYIEPAANPRGKLVIVHQGHDPTLVDPNPVSGGDGHLGLARAMNNLLLEGYGVIGMYMPGDRPGDTSGNSHPTLIEHTPVTAGSGLQFFMDPVLKFLNYAINTGLYTNYYMMGLSGGGWTTTVYAAIDPRIEMSFPVAGTVPLFMRSCSSSGDAEDYFDHTFYGIAGYQDLYILGSYGAIPTGGQRHQTQVLNRNDSCCFGMNEYSDPPNWDNKLSAYEIAVRNKLQSLGLGMFRLEIDENTTTVDGQKHMVSTGALFRTILGELNIARRTIGRHQSSTGSSSSNDAWYRGVSGHLWHRTISPLAEVDTGVAIEGVAESAQSPGTATFNAIARNIHGSPVLISSTSSGGWTSRVFQGTINNDPTIISGKTGTALWVFATGADYLPYVWDSNGNYTSIPGPPALGPISASLRGMGAGFHIFYLGWDRTVRHAYRVNATSPWQTESLGGTTFGYPTGVVDSNGNLVVFQLGTDGLLYWNRKFLGDQNPGNSWTGWTSISNSAGGGAVLNSMPGFFGGSGTWTVLVPLRSGGHIGKFTITNPSNVWSYTNLGGNFTSPFTTHSTGAFLRDLEMHMWDWTVSAGSSFVGGSFD
jgi:hypothetical protein